MFTVTASTVRRPAFGTRAANRPAFRPRATAERRDVGATMGAPSNQLEALQEMTVVVADTGMSQCLPGRHCDCDWHPTAPLSLMPTGNTILTCCWAKATLKQAVVIGIDLTTRTHAGDVSQIKEYKPIDCTTNPSLLYKVVDLPAYESILKQALQEELADPENIDKERPYSGAVPGHTSLHTPAIPSAPSCCASLRSM